MEMEGKEKKRGRKSKVGIQNESFDLDDTPQKVKEVVSPFLNNIRAVHSKNNNTKSRALEAVVDAKKSVSKWKEYVNKKRKKKKTSSIMGGQQDGTMRESESQKNDQTCLGLDDIHEDFVSGKQKVFGEPISGKTMSSASSRALLQYFSKLGKDDKDGDVVDLDFVETLVKNGANINCTDKHGQTLLHEVASKWHTDVARFLIDMGSNVNKADHFGRTPLHVAAADNYPEMIHLLIDSGADREAVTSGEKQTPLHYAAKNDATEALKALVKRKCEYKNVFDHKNRSPLHLAAELDRSETARLLLDLEAPCGMSDRSGMSTISWMISKMPPVALEAITQFHVKDRPNRKQYYYLNFLCPDKVKDPNFHTMMPLAVAVKFKQYDILTQNAFVTLTQQMWLKFARWRAYASLLFNLVYILLWTLYGVTTEYDERHEYKLPEHWWRIVLLIAAVGCTLWQIIEEIREYRRSQQIHENYKKWREQDIEEDLKYCHPRWPEERNFLEKELENLNESHTRYFSDMWNWFDWLCYALLLAVIITHFVDIAHHTLDLARAHIRLTAVVIIFLWVRLMKNIRAFSLLGPFVVMVGAMATDILKFGFLYLEFYIPYVCAFWMIFGGTKYPESTESGVNRAENVTVPGFDTFNAAMFSMWRMTLVDEYAYEDMKNIDSIMADILVGTWLFLSAVLCLNLLIALFSDTFQRVYDNAKANALMQKAIMILSFWEGMSHSAKNRFLDHIDGGCAPLSLYYDDDMTESDDADLKKVTIQIKEELDDLMSKWHAEFGNEDEKTMLDELQEEDQKHEKLGKMVTTQKFNQEIENLRDDIRLGLIELQEQQKKMMTHFTREMQMVKSLLLDISGQSRPVGQPRGRPGSQGPASHDGSGFSLYMSGMEEGEPSHSSLIKTGKRKKKKSSILQEGPLLDEASLPGQLPSAGQPHEVDVSTHDFLLQDPFRTNVVSGFSTSSHDDHSVA